MAIQPGLSIDKTFHSLHLSQEERLADAENVRPEWGDYRWTETLVMMELSSHPGLAALYVPLRSDP